jgi:hypothetical protein
VLTFADLRRGYAAARNRADRRIASKKRREQFHVHSPSSINVMSGNPPPKMGEFNEGEYRD